jgi:hypothetical protein
MSRIERARATAPRALIDGLPHNQGKNQLQHDPERGMTSHASTHDVTLFAPECDICAVGM